MIKITMFRGFITNTSTLIDSLVQVLLENPLTDVSALNEDGLTPKQLALQYNHSDIVALLSSGLTRNNRTASHPTAELTPALECAEASATSHTAHIHKTTFAANAPIAAPLESANQSSANRPAENVVAGYGPVERQQGEMRLEHNSMYACTYVRLCI